MEFRDALKMLRNELGLAQADIAAALHINIATVGRWEQGKNVPNRSCGIALLDYAKSKSATSKCIDTLETALNQAVKKKLFSNKNSLFTAERATISQLIDDAAFPIYVCDLNTDEILYANSATEQKLGKSLDSLIGKKCYEYIMCRNTPCEFCHKNELNDDSFKGYDTYWPCDGKTYHVQGKLIQWNGHTAQVRYILNPGSSPELRLTDTKKSMGIHEKHTTQRDQIAELLNDTPSGIAIIEADKKDISGTMRTTYYNDRFISFSGYTRNEYNARHKDNDMAFVFREDIPKLLKAIKKACAGEIGMSIDSTVRCHIKDGGFRWLLLTGQLVERRGDICVINVAVMDVTEMQEAIDRQRINEEMLRIAAETDQRSMIVYDVKNNTCRAESRTLFSARYGETFENIPQSLIDIGLTAPDSEDELCSLFSRIREGEKKICVSLQLRTGPDKYEWFECSAATVFDAEGLPDHAVLVFHNITEQLIKEAVFKKWQQSIDARPAESYTLFRCNLSKDSSLDQQNGSLLKISFPSDAMSFNSRTKLYADKFVYPDDRKAYVKLLDSDLLLAMFYRGEHFASLEYREITENGDVVWRNLTVETVEYPGSTDIQAFLMYEDIDEKKKAEIEAKKLAETDPLTGALNRGAFLEKVDEFISNNPNSHCALIMLDMDGFKQLNDTFGHAAGDQALHEVVAVLRSYARDGDLVCRLGGDEFMLWLSDVPYDAVIGKTAQQMCEHIRKAYSQEVSLSVSAGIAVYPRDGYNYDELYQNADKALYKVKQTGKGSYAFFSATDEEQTNDIKEALSAVKPSPQSLRGSKRRMLIVDDNETNRLMLKNIFKDEYIIETAKNGSEAMIRLRHFGVSLSVVLLDLMMPGVDGFTVLRRMQSDVDLRTIPVIVVTGDEDRATLLKAFDLGAAEYVMKPVDVDIIRMRVKAVISKAENERLRAQNSYLMLQRDEEVKYHTVLESTGTAVIEYDWRNHVFIYDKEISKHIAGNFDHRGIWQVFLSDMVADSADVKNMQDTLLNLSGNREQNQDSKLVKLNTPEGVKHWFRVNFYKHVDDFGLAEKLIITFNDVHDEVLATDKLLFQATRDELTGLYNRTGFLEKATELIAAKKPGYYVMACIDVEKFQLINDRYGTEKGDEVLKHIALTIDSLAQKHKGLCCRYTADKFAILYPSKLLNTDELEENHRIAIAPGGLQHPLRLRVGRCLVSDTTLPTSAIFDRAAMAEASAVGRYNTSIVNYDDSMRDKILKEQQIAVDMVDALRDGEFEPWFQPQYNHATGALIGAEALVRWRKDGKIIPPNDFIPVFEKNGFIYDVDQYVWRSVCILLRRWLDEGKKPLPVSVNISRHDMLQENFIDVITGLVTEYRLPVELLRLEITESAFSADTKTITEIAGKLIDAGFTVEIDDFGSGYSSLNTLKDVPASILKLDMRFFERTGDANRGGNIVESIVRMAKWLGMAVIAEGVEDKAQADYLKSIGCYYIQGYFYAKPMPEDEYEKLLDASDKEAQMSRLQTLQNLDNNEFWDSRSMDTLIFNSYVGAACILELNKGKVEMLRTTDHFAQMLCDNKLDIKDILDIDWAAHMDNHNVRMFKDAAQKSVETKESVSSEFEFHDIPGCSKTVILRCHLRVIATAGDRLLIYCLNENITAQREAEHAALIASERINAVMDNSHCGISAVIPRSDGTVELLFANNRFFELLGYTRKQYEAEVKSIYDRLFPEDRKKIREFVKHINDIGSSASLEVREIHRNGSIIWLRVDISIVRFANIPEPVQISSFLDITQQKKNELKQLEDAHQLEIIMSNVNGGVSAIQVFDDATSKFVFNNDKYYGLYGYSKEEALANHLDIMSLILPEDLPVVMAKIKQMKEDRQPCLIDYRITKKDGSYAMLRANSSLMSIPAYGDDVITSVVMDITETKSLEERLNAIIDNINGGISAVYLKNDKPEYVIANEQYYKILGYTKEEFEAESINPFDLLHPDDREWVKKKFTETQKRGECYTMEYRIIRHDGAVRNILCNTSVLQLFGIDEPLQLAVSNDITELREAQSQELAMKDRLNTVMNTMSNGITAVAFHDDGMEILFINNRFFEIHGISRDGSDKDSLAAAINLVLPEFQESIDNAFREAEKTWSTVSYECQIRRPDGALRWLRVIINMTKFVGIDVPVRVAVSTDITDEKEATDQLRFLNDTAHDILAQSDSEQALKDTLTNIVAYFSADRSYIIELDESRMVLTNTYEICADGVKAEMGNWQSHTYSESDFWYETLSRNKFFTIDDVNAMDDSQSEFRDMLISYGIHSIILAPLWRDGHLAAFAGVDNPTHTLHQFDQFKAFTDYCSILLGRRDVVKSLDNERKIVQQLMDDTPGGFLRMELFEDKNPIIIAVNDGLCKMLGMTRDELMKAYGNDVYACLADDDAAAAPDEITQAFLSGKQYTSTCKLRRKDGSLFWVMFFGRFVHGENGKLFLNSYFTDITEKLTTEENQKTLLDNLPFGAAMYEFDGERLKALHINRQYQIMVARTRDNTTLENYSPADFIHPDDRRIALDSIKEAIANNRDADCNIRILYGKDEYRSFHLDARITAQPDNKYLVYVAYTRLSDQELTFENALPHIFSTIMESSTDLAFAKDINFRYICCSRTFATLLGLESEDEVIGKTDYELFPRVIADMFRRDDSLLFTTQRPQIDVREMLPSPDGTKHYIRTSKHLLRNDTDAVIGIYCIGRDITEIHEAYAQLQLLTNSIPGGIATFRCSSENIEVLYYNEGICELAGYSREEYTSNPVPLMDFVLEEDRPIIRKQLELLQSGETNFNFTFRIRPKNGGYKWINAISTISDHLGESYSVNAVMTDITEHQEEKERLRLAEEEYHIATVHSGHTIGRYDIAAKTLNISEDASSNLALPELISDVPYGRVKLGKISKATAKEYIAFYEKIMNGEKECSATFQKLLSNGWHWITGRATTIFDNDGKPISAIISYSDVTDQQEKEAVYKKWQQNLTQKQPDSYTLYRCNLNQNAGYDTVEGNLLNIHDVWSKVDIKTFNERALDFAERCVVEKDRKMYLQFVNSDTMLASYYRGKRSASIEFSGFIATGEIHWIRLSVELVEYPHTKDVAAYLMYEDINDNVLEELHIKKLAETDPLTGLQNRKFFIDRFNNLIGRNKKDCFCALFLIDIDGFKLINDTFGHDVGDESIINMAKTISCVFKNDEYLSRLGGDEFLVCLPDMPSRDSVADKARELCEAAHIKVKNDIQISVSIGVALVTDEGDNFDSMYHKADKALYHVKGHGKNNFAFYEADMERSDNEVIADAVSNSLTPLENGKNTMLVVDDSAINRLVTAGMFKNYFSIVEAENGQTALDYLREHSDEVAIVLLDIMMPVMDGYELLAIMKTEPELREIPVIVISGEDDRKASLRAIQAGASDYVVKPVDRELLRLRVSAALNKSENGRLRKEYERLAIEHQELHSYRSLMDNNATALIEFNAKTGGFKYAPKTGTYLNGTFDERPMWQIFAEDQIASDSDAEVIRKMITESDKPCKATFKLMTPDGTAHPFLIKVMMRDASENDDMVLITFTDKE